jgi:nucleoside-diphosphate-sugar epimerase
MPVIVTGAGGFVGRALLPRLVAAGHQVVAVDSIACPDAAGISHVTGDLTDPAVRAAALARGCTALVHLATVPGGAAEADPERAWAVNVEAGRAMLQAAAAAGNRPRVVFASSIAVFGEPLPPAVDDGTAASPRLHYGAHKAMMEVLVATLSNRGAIDGISLRLPGIVARPAGASGLKSAFLSDLFEQLRRHQPFVCPVSALGQVWLQSVSASAANLAHALDIDTSAAPPGRAITLPALRVRIDALIAAISVATGANPALVAHDPDPLLEAGFAAQPPLYTPAADALGFRHDGTVAALVASALAALPPIESQCA